MQDFYEKAEDKRNLVDELKGLSNEEVIARLDERRNDLEIAIWNVAHDFNMGTIVRNANNFNVQKVHIMLFKNFIIWNPKNRNMR